MPELVPVIESEDIRRTTEEIAGRLSVDYQGKDLVMVGVLKGAFLFLGDVARQMSIPFRIDFIHASSYGAGTETSGDVALATHSMCELSGKHVLIVEDIIDTGLTVQRILSHFETLGPASLKVCTMLDKPARRRVPLEADYVGHQVPDVFLVGYGMDYDEAYRQLPGIYQLQF